MRTQLKNNVKNVLLAAIAGLFVTNAAIAATPVSSDITTSTTWTKANGPYYLTKQVYVTNGATLTIEPGVVVASYVITDPASPEYGLGLGSLAVCRDGKIKVMGTASDPVIMTSAQDVMSWTGSVVVKDANNKVSAITSLGNPKTGSWHEGAKEWGNLTLMGNALIGAQYLADGSSVRTYQDGASASIVSNTATPTGLNKATMEGLTAAFAGDPKVLYGGNNDDDSSGEIHYLSLRYGGKVIGLANELNGLSLGGIGRGTKIDHVEIMNNVDDGIEIWGGAVNLKYLSIWDIGDDSFDVDEGWRGKAQFGLAVQGYSLHDSQGSGTGDNIFEIDGAESNAAQPVACATLYNWTVIGMPDGLGGAGTTGADHCFTFRDGARMQYRQIVVMDVGEKLIQEESSEGGVTANWRYGNTGGGLNTLYWGGGVAGTDVWNTSYSDTWNTSNALAGGHANLSNYLGTAGHMTSAQIQQMYQSQSAGNNASSGIAQGFMTEVTDSIFFNLANSAAFANSNNLGSSAGKVTTAGGSTSALGNVVASTLPIKSYSRAAAVNTSGTLNFRNVISLDPRANNDAVTSVDTAPIDGFFTPVRYRGAFSPNVNWLLGWTATDAYGFHAGQTNPTDPTATLAMYMTTTTFNAADSVSYTVESSVDGRNWVPFSVVPAGSARVVTISNLIGYDSAKLYRVSVQ